MTGVGVLAIGAFALGSCAPACVEYGPVGDRGPAVPERPVCQGTPVAGVGSVVTFMWDDVVTCDMTGDQVLNIVFDDSYDAAWGGDASVARAAQECDDMGGRQVWVHSPYRLVCENVDQ